MLLSGSVMHAVRVSHECLVSRMLLSGSAMHAVGVTHAAVRVSHAADYHRLATLHAHRSFAANCVIACEQQ